MQIRKRIRAMLTEDPKHDLLGLLPRLQTLRDEIVDAGDPRNDFPARLVQFFNTISPWGDQEDVNDLLARFERVNYGQYDDVVRRLRILRQHFVGTGRDLYGMNRTRPGQTVTEDDVFLGNIFGLFTHPVSFWNQYKDDKKGGWGIPQMEHLNAYNLVSGQAAEFLVGHVMPMVGIINWLERSVSAKEKTRIIPG